LEVSEVRPKPFIPEAFASDGHYVRDQTGGLVWHCSRMRPLYADTDRSQVVYHANFLRYFEFGRASLMRDAAYPYKEIEDSGTIYPIIQIGVDYYSPVYYDDLLCIYTRPALIERVRLRFDYVITHEQTRDIACQGFTRHCAVNGKGVPVEVDPKTAHLWKIFPQ
jgi:acyl-CoA thioester hydrolase